MKKILNYCFDIWLRPIIFFVLTIGIFIVSEIINQSIIQNICFLLLGIGLLGLIISTFYQFINKRWIKGILTILIFVATIICFYFYSVAMFWKIQSEPDRFADNLKIPINIHIDTPIDMNFNEKRPDSVTNRKVISTDFQLYNSFQPGLYEFDFWIGKIEKGTIYLKAYEITQNYALSTDRLPKRSSVKVYNCNDSIVRFGTTSDFTIYEGDWGKPYAARFEVWFKPDNNGQERKLFEKNYKIEGWQR
jgi:hypothetical protein